MSTSEPRPPHNADPPVACSLPSSQLRDRLATWQRLADDFLRDQHDIPGGVALTYRDRPGVEPTLRELADLESDCCAWAVWHVRLIDDGVRLEVTAASSEREEAVRTLFARR